MASEPPSISLRKAHHFFGVARIDLNKLTFNVASPNGHRTESKKIQAKLLNVFELEGCRRMEQEHFIDALISRESLSEALSSHGKTIESFRDSCNTSYGSLHDILWLKPSQSLQCLSGLHRVAAAKRFLNKNDRWWTVRLYEKGHFEADLTNHIQEAFGHEQHYTDGTIFRNIRRYNRTADEENEKKWWARLTASKRRDLKQLLKDRRFVNAFDSLIELPGLWPPIQLGTLHRQHGLRCSEVLYLEHVRDVWYTTVPQDSREYLDEHTVQELELLAPGMSQSDREKVTDLFNRGRVFPRLTDSARREDLLRSVLSQRCLIPTLRTFFENQKYLEPCSMILRTLLDDTDKRSLWQSFRANFFQPDALLMPLSDNVDDLEVLAPVRSNNLETAFSLGYIHLWMFCFRHFPEMTRIKPRLETRHGLQTPQRHINTALLLLLARLAVNLGFRTDKAVALANEDPDLLAAEQFLRSAKPNWDGDISKQVADIKRILTEIGRSSQPNSRFFEFTARRSLLKERRCGRPFEQDHVQDRSALFAPIMYCQVESGAEFSSLYAKTDTFKAFFKYCIPIEDNIVRNVLGVWAQVAERDMITDVPEERPTTDRAVNTQQLRNDLQQCHDMRLRDAAELRSLSSELTQARARIETLQAALQSAQRDCSKCSDHESLKSELDRLRDQIRSKDRTIEELEQQNIDSAIPDNEFFSDHRNENIGNGYDELQRDYEQLQATAEELETGLKAEVKSLQDRMEIETKKYEELQHEYDTYRAEATQQESAMRLDLDNIKTEMSALQLQHQHLEDSHARTLDEKRERIEELEKQQSNWKTELAASRDALDDAEGSSVWLERHRRVNFPLDSCAADDAELRFQSDVRCIIEQYVTDEFSSDYLTVREIMFDEEGLGFRSRLFRMRKENDQIEKFLAWLCPREQYVFNRCIEFPGGHLDFQMIPDADAQALMSASAEKIQIFYGEKDYFLPEAFPQRYRNGRAFGLPPGSKRAMMNGRTPKSKRRPNPYAPDAERTVTPLRLWANATGVPGQTSVLEDPVQSSQSCSRGAEQLPSHVDTDTAHDVEMLMDSPLAEVDEATVTRGC